MQPDSSCIKLYCNNLLTSDGQDMLESKFIMNKKSCKEVGRESQPENQRRPAFPIYITDYSDYNSEKTRLTPLTSIKPTARYHNLPVFIQEKLLDPADEF